MGIKESKLILFEQIKHSSKETKKGKKEKKAGVLTAVDKMQDCHGYL
jgi:hypothetical protein